LLAAPFFVLPDPATFRQFWERSQRSAGNVTTSGPAVKPCVLENVLMELRVLDGTLPEPFST